MRAHRTASHSSKRVNVFGVLQAALETPNEAQWYAQRLELLGRTLFGDLWESDKYPSEGREQNHEA